MGESTLIEAAKLAIVGLFSGGIGILTFSGKYQTKGGCKKAHDAYELTQIARRETQEAKLQTVAVQQKAMHEDVKEIRKLVDKIAGDVYVPRGTTSSRRSD